jgi:hypothetical protein
MLLPLLLGISCIVRNPLGYIFLKAYDDSYYYLQTAIHIVNGRGSTFDGVAATNGYQPLWMAICIVIRWIVRDRWWFAVAMGLVQLMVFTAALFVLERAWRNRLGVVWAPLLVLALASHVFWAATNLMESGLNLLLLAAMCQVIFRSDEGDPLIVGGFRGQLKLAAVLAAAMYARLDNAIIVLGLLSGYCACAVAMRSLRVFLRLGAVVGVSTLVMTPYLLWNLSRFGSFVPVSGRAKLLLAFHPGAPKALATRLGEALRASLNVAEAPTWLALWVALPLLAVFAIRAVRRENCRSAVVGGVIVGLVLHFAYYAAFSVEGVYPWYRLPYAVATSCFVAMAASTIARWFASRGKTRRNSWLARLVAGMVALACIASFVGRGRAEWRRAAQADDVRRRPHVALINGLAHSCPGARAAGWNAGLTGYAFEGRLTNLDGLMNDSKYLDEYLGKYRAIEYVLERKFEFVIDYDRFLGVRQRRIALWAGTTEAAYETLLQHYRICRVGIDDPAWNDLHHLGVVVLARTGVECGHCEDLAGVAR